MSALPLLLSTLFAASCGGALGPQAQVNAALDNEVLALKTRQAYLEEQLKTCADPAPPALYSELRQVFPDGDVKVDRQGRAVVLTIPNGVLFVDNGVRLRQESEQVLDLVAIALNQHPDWAVLVEVHTDETRPTGTLAKTYPTNWELSAARAAMLVRELSDRYHVSPSRLTAAGRGSVQPVADNSTSEGRDLNRRVRLVLTPMESP